MERPRYRVSFVPGHDLEKHLIIWNFAYDIAAVGPFRIAYDGFEVVGFFCCDLPVDLS